MSYKLCVLVIGLLCWETTKAYTCTPTTDCTNLGAGALVPDPVDCQRYYVCINSPNGPIPATTPSECPDGQYFDGDSGACVAESSPGICNSACGSNVCGLNCPTNSSTITSIPSSNDCSVYYICTTDGTAIPITCPIQIPFFNGVECVNDETQCCSCRPHCRVSGSQIQDPCDCGSYYICSSIGQPHDINRGTCPVGYYFDVNLAQCIAGNCVNACQTCSTF